ncbi:MAG: ATPase [Thermoprotei archaeon]|nr:MAG: ATPase [Thermoprotei archaeon]
MEVLREIYIPDSTAIVRGILRRKIKQRRIAGKIVIHTLLVEMFERMTREENRVIGTIGLTELERICSLINKSEKDNLSIEFTREIPSNYRLYRFERVEDVDKMLRELASEWNAVLITCDPTQKLACKAMGVEVLFEDIRKKRLLFEKFFIDKDIMSIHLKEDSPPYAKKGTPGRWKFVKLRDEPIPRKLLEEIERDILEMGEIEEDGFIEIDRPGSSIIMLKNYRIVITRPPFSDGLEITIVKPIARLSLEDYNLPKRLLDRLDTRAEGIIIAGAPGMGKTTFAQALADHYLRKGKIVKTIESPRDMNLPPDITQYSKTHGTSEELHDVLLLSRPDYTFFDEMRDTRDFELYTDLRLAGVGMVGVIHAASPIDAIQRFIGRVELGMIPSVVDTIIFIKNGKVSKIYELETIVKVPHGLREAELARPVVLVRDFLTGEVEYELYVFGERTFVVPVKKQYIRGGNRVLMTLERTLAKYIPREEFEIRLCEDGYIEVLVQPKYLNSISTKVFKRLKRTCRKYGVGLEIKPLS